jgi:hypothetical protein
MSHLIIPVRHDDVVTHVKPSRVTCIIIMCDSYDHLWLVLSCVTWLNVCDFIIMSHMYYQV